MEKNVHIISYVSNHRLLLVYVVFPVWLLEVLLFNQELLIFFLGMAGVVKDFQHICLCEVYHQAYCASAGG